MKEWFTRIVLLAALGALGYWAWSLVFPSPEKVIRRRLAELARTASFSANEGAIAKGWNVTLLADYFTLDVQVTIDVLQAALGARQTVSSLKIDFPDIQVAVAPGKDSAVVNLTARGKVTGQKEFYLQELQLRLLKVKRDWLIDKIVTVRTLS